MSNIASRREFTMVVRGRQFRIERITWKNSNGLSFDVYDGPTGLLLTNESYDREPTVGVVESLIDDLADDVRGGTLDSAERGGIFDGEEVTLREIIEATYA